MKLLEKITNDPRVEWVAYEGPNWDNGECWWVGLREGYTWYGAISIHERTLTNVLKALRQVKKTPKP